MRAILQRVNSCQVHIEGTLHSEIDNGLLLLIGFEPTDRDEDLTWMKNKVLNMRIFEDREGKMNRSILDCHGQLMIVSQFTLHASTKKGNRPSFIKAAKPEIAIPLYQKFIVHCRKDIGVKTGEFGANMQLTIENDGPVTLILDSHNKDI